MSLRVNAFIERPTRKRLSSEPFPTTGSIIDLPLKRERIRHPLGTIVCPLVDPGTQVVQAVVILQVRTRVAVYEVLNTL